MSEATYQWQVLWTEDGAPRRSTARDETAARQIVASLTRKTMSGHRIQRRLITAWEDVT